MLILGLVLVGCGGDSGPPTAADRVEMYRETVEPAQPRPAGRQVRQAAELICDSTSAGALSVSLPTARDLLGDVGAEASRTAALVEVFCPNERGRVATAARWLDLRLPPAH